MTNEQYIAKAVLENATDECEFDDTIHPEVSRGDNGAWVACWVWTYDKD